jgi:hypothetical protein
MTTTYNPPSVEPTYEDSSSEDERKGVMRFQDEDSPNESSHRHFRSSHESGMSPTNANIGRERSRKAHKSGRHTSKSKSKNTGVKRASMITTRDNGSDGLRLRHHRTLSGRSASSTNSSSDEDEPIPDHREVLAAARARLTSPSTISTLTTLTTSTFYCHTRLYPQTFHVREKTGGGGSTVISSSSGPSRCVRISGRGCIS